MSDNAATTNIENTKDNQKSGNDLKRNFQIVSSIVLGIVFGYLMNKANVYRAPIIRDQMLFKRLIMLKMFVGAVGASMLSAFILILFNESIYRKVLNDFIQRHNRINIVHLAIGGSLIGIGMVLAGSCPGTIFVQIGSGLRNSIFTSLGACFGVLFYYKIVHTYLLKGELPKDSIECKQLPEIIGMSRVNLTLICSLLFVSLGFILEYFVPYKNELNSSYEYSIKSGWSPTFCGIGVGLLQLFFMISFEKSLGISTGFTIIVAQFCRIKAFKEFLPSLNSFAYGLNNYLTLLFSLGAIIGSFISTLSTNEFPLNSIYGANVFNSFLGGFFLLVGARCAGGCTSGQGISGVTHFLIGSLVATAAMFGGGIAFAFAYGLLTNDWHFSAL